MFHDMATAAILEARASSDSCYHAALEYKPSKVGNAVVAGCYALISFGLFVRLATNRGKGKWPLWLACSTLTSAAGDGIRVALNPCNFQLGTFIPQVFLVVLSPCAFLAFNYMLYKRIVVAIDPTLHNNPSKKAKSKYSFLPPLIVSHIFVWSDIQTFMIQSAGGSITTSKSLSTIKIGNDLFLVGVILQLVSFTLFTALSIVAWIRIRREGSLLTPTIRKLFFALYFSSACILIRSVYRVVEFASGSGSEIQKHEWNLFAFDAAPLILATGIFVIVYPCSMLQVITEQSASHEMQNVKENSTEELYNYNSQGYPASQQEYSAPQQGYPVPQQGYPGPQGYSAPV